MKTCPASRRLSQVFPKSWHEWAPWKTCSLLTKIVTRWWNRVSISLFLRISKLKPISTSVLRKELSSCSSLQSKSPSPWMFKQKFMVTTHILQIWSLGHCNNQAITALTLKASTRLNPINKTSTYQASSDQATIPTIHHSLPQESYESPRISATKRKQSCLEWTISHAWNRYATNLFGRNLFETMSNQAAHTTWLI